MSSPKTFVEVNTLPAYLVFREPLFKRFPYICNSLHGNPFRNVSQLSKQFPIIETDVTDKFIIMQSQSTVLYVLSSGYLPLELFTNCLLIW